MAQNKKGNGSNLGFEAELFKAADKLRGNMEPSDYKHVALGLIFLKYISDAFEARPPSATTAASAAPRPQALRLPVAHRAALFDMCISSSNSVHDFCVTLDR